MRNKMIIMIALASTLLLLIGAAAAILFYFLLPMREGRDRAPAQSGLSVRSFSSNHTQRIYLLFAPPGIDINQPLPLVISLAPFGGNPRLQRYLSRWDRLADQRHFLVAYPQGTSFPLRFNAGPAYKIPSTDDVQMIRDLIADIGRLHNLDHQRIYVTGMSGGAHMVDRIARELAEQVAAVGMVSGAYLACPESGQTRLPIPVIAFQGAADPFGIYRGRREDSRILLGMMKIVGLAPGEVVEIPAFDDWADDWAKRNGCDLEAAEWEVNGEARRLRYPNHASHAEVEIYVIEGGGHTWPGGRPTFLGRTSRSIDASQVMWDFFARHTLGGKVNFLG